jgi:hypothetical protein
VAAALRAPLPAGAAAGADARLRRLDARVPGLLLLAFFALGAECLHVFEFTRGMAKAAGEVAHAVAAEPAGEAAPAASPEAVATEGGDGEAGCGAADAPSTCAALAAD